jgi:hypothetical protein
MAPGLFPGTIKSKPKYVSVECLSFLHNCEAEKSYVEPS